MPSPGAWDDSLSKQQDLVGAEVAVHISTGRHRGRLPPGRCGGLGDIVRVIPWGSLGSHEVWRPSSLCGTQGSRAEATAGDGELLLLLP